MSHGAAESPASGGSTTIRNSRRWLLFGALGVVVFVAVVFAAMTLRLFVFPSTDQPTHVDGIVSLNGSNEGARTALAVSLAEKGYAPVILFSRGGEKADTSCPKVPKIAVVCFVDVPNNTRGEAEWAGRYAQQHDWHSLMIVPGRSQVTRARLLTERCFSGRVVVVPISASRPALSDILHQWGGLFSSLLVHRSC
jgi:uncharacterized SAM-binding protein YcdF (DUF218 family)